MYLAPRRETDRLTVMASIRTWLVEVSPVIATRFTSKRPVRPFPQRLRHNPESGGRDGSDSSLPVRSTPMPRSAALVDARRHANADRAAVDRLPHLDRACGHTDLSVSWKERPAWSQPSPRWLTMRPASPSTSQPLARLHLGVVQVAEPLADAPSAPDTPVETAHSARSKV